MTASVERYGVMGPIRLAVASLQAQLPHQQPILVQVNGPSGAGKTSVLETVAKEARGLGLSTAELDLQIVELQTPSGFVEGLISVLDIDKPHSAAGFSSLLSQLRSTLEAHAAPLVISIDSVDHGSGAVQAIDMLLSMSSASVLVVTADRTVRQYLAERVTDIHVAVQNFSIEEIYDLIVRMQDSGQLAGVTGARQLATDLFRSLAGVPALVRLALEAEDIGLIEFARLPAQAQQSVPRRVLSGLHDRYPVAGKEWEVLRLVSAPMHPAFLADLIGEPLPAIETGLEIGERLGAVRNCGNGTYRLHDEVARQLRVGGAAGPEWLRQRAAELIASGRASTDLERLFLSTLADDAALLGEVLDRLQTSLRAGYGTGTRLVVETSGVLAEAIDDLGCSQRLRAGAKIAMSYAFTRDHDSSGAVSSLDAVRELAHALPDMRPRWLLARAHATLSPARLPGQTLQTASDDAREAAGLFQAQNDTPQQIAALVTLARALNLQGRHNDAHAIIDDVLRMTDNAGDVLMTTLRADALDELGELYRLTQEVAKSEAHLLEARRLRATIGEGWSVGAAYGAWIWANLLRDRGDFDLARREYDVALEGASAVGDEFLAQDIINDQSWLAYLAGENDEAEALLEQQARILDARGLHAGYVTYHHGWHHLYMRQGLYERAWVHLADALALARHASHMYMLVDCLCHDAVRGLHIKDEGVILASIAELEALAATGCRFDGFRGRARMTLGDFYWMKSRDDAFDQWLAGLQIVTDYGDSRRYEHSIADMIGERSTELSDVLTNPSNGDRWKAFWRQASASDETRRVALELLRR